jgi:hypothetical protein
MKIISDIIYLKYIKNYFNIKLFIKITVIVIVWWCKKSLFRRFFDVFFKVTNIKGKDED